MGEGAAAISHVALPDSGGHRYNLVARAVRGDGAQNAFWVGGDWRRSDCVSGAFERIEAMAVCGGSSMRKRWLAMFAALGVMGMLTCVRAARAQSAADVVDAIDHAHVSTRILYVTAHPDDERSSVLTYLSRGLGATVALCSTTRGEGGQNAIGPELGP